MGIWAFEEQRGAAVRRAPQESELFKSEQAAEGEYAGNDALVREILQNSIDASTGTETLRVRMAVHEAGDAPVAARLRSYFDRLREPLHERGIGFSAQGHPEIPCRFLVCEDFGTRGLEGDVRRCSDPAPGDVSKHDFYWFWRNIGRSGKTGEELGRWGLGKLVYRAASKVGCMLGLTVRSSDRKSYLMGQAVLQIHRLDDKEYMPEGYWCGVQDDDGVPLPVDDAEELETFRREWKLTRRDEPGLSVVAPYIHPEINARRLLEAVTVHFFLPILRGELIVEIAGGDLPTVALDRNAIDACCKSITWDGPKKMKRHVAPPLVFARRCLSMNTLTETALLGGDRLPDLNDGAFDDDTLHSLRRRYAEGELIGIRAHLWLPKTSSPGVEGKVDVYLQKLRDGTRCESYYVREGMTITKISSSASRRGVHSLVIVEPGPLAELLGDTEGPAHEDWNTSADRPNKEWRTWKGRVRFVRRIVDNFVELLTPPVTEPDFDLLADFFSIEQIERPQRQPRIGDDNDRLAGMGEIEAKPQWFNIHQRAGGFTLGRTNGVDVPPGAKLRITVAYDIPKGNPIRNWSPLDFKFVKDGAKGLIPRGQGLKAEKVKDNVIEVGVESEDFKLLVEGFDHHRDLFVRIDAIEPDGEDSST